MTYLLDTNVCIEYLRGKAVGVRKRMETLSPGDIVLCSMVTHNTQEFGRIPGLQMEDWQI